MRARLARHASPAGSWETAIAAPAPVLAGAVRRYVGYYERTPGPLRRRELPQAEAQLIVSFGPAIEVPGTGARGVSFAVGVDDAGAVIAHDGEQHGVGVMLAPPAARALLRLPMPDLNQALVSLEDALGPAARELEERLAQAPDWDARFALLDHFLARRLAEAEPVPAPVRWAWEQLVRSRGRVRVDDLALELGWSRRHLSTRFADHVGLPPKRFARLLRFRDAVDRMRDEDRPDLGRIALDAGYYDQSHFNRDFRAFAGVTPSELLARRLPAELGYAA